MSKRLHRRVRNVGGNHRKAMDGYTPVDRSSQVTGSAASPGGAPGVMPLAQVVVYPDPANTAYSTIGYQGLAPIYAAPGSGGAGGAPIPATSPGRWGQLVTAGRP